MKLTNSTHLSYCTNIHAGESWPAVFQSLQEYLPPIKATISPEAPFGIGLRLSNEASVGLYDPKELKQFQEWLASEALYVFTMNGFPYGGFHDTIVKDQVHAPDWRTKERVDYTKRLFSILSQLLPEGEEGGISTSPLTYKHWISTAEERNTAYKVATQNILRVAEYLIDIYQETGQILHLDIEPEPDGLLENTAESIDFFQNWLLPMGREYFADKSYKDPIDTLLLQHITICYDVCHFAIEYEEPAWVFQQFENAGIKIGKIQISAALQADLPEEITEREAFKQAFLQFNESTYLHQVIALSEDGSTTNFPDLPEALAQMDNPDFTEWRTHFHVPIFLEQYGLLSSTRSEIEKVLMLQKINPVSPHLEVETYTWEVLPTDMQLDLRTSIEREMNWLLDFWRESI